jgi:hypothetical protein
VPLLDLPLRPKVGELDQAQGASRLDVLMRPLLTRKGIVERVSCDLPVDERLIRVGYAEVLEAKVRERLAAHPEELASASVAFSSVSARGELREARLVSPEPVPRA